MREADVHRVLSMIGSAGSRAPGSDWVNTPCPLAPWRHKHGSDSRPSFGIKIVENGSSFCSCFSCHFSGSLGKLVSILDGYRGTRSPMALYALVDQEQFSFVPPKFGELAAQEAQPEYYPDSLFEGAWDAAWDVPQAKAYLQSRKCPISESTAAKLELLWDDEDDRVMFPVRGLGGELYGFTGRAINPLRNPKIKDYAGLPKKHLILGCHLWEPLRPVIIVEGLFAYASLIERGVDGRYNVGALLGSVMTEQKAELIKNFFAPVYLMLDPDDAGRLGTWGDQPSDEAITTIAPNSAVGRLLGSVSVSVTTCPEGVDDVDLLTKDQIFEMVRTAQWVHTRHDNPGRRSNRRDYRV